MGAKPSKVTNRRVARTDARLRQAFIDSVRDRGYHNVSLREVVRRAAVGRSTFYTHFGDLDELHGCILRDFLRRKRANEPVLGFAGPFFEHAGKQGLAWIGAPGKEDRTACRQGLRKAVLMLFREELGPVCSKLPPAAAEAAAQYLTGAFTDLLFWWIDTPNGLSSAQIEEVFRRLTAGAFNPLARHSAGTS